MKEKKLTGFINTNDLFCSTNLVQKLDVLFTLVRTGDENAHNTEVVLSDVPYFNPVDNIFVIH